MKIWIDTETKVEKKKRNGEYETPFKNMFEALGGDDTEESYTIKLLREI